MDAVLRLFKLVANGTCLSDKKLDVPLDYENIKNIDTVFGSGSIIVMDEDNSIVDAARFYTKFISEQSCGKCIVALLEWDVFLKCLKNFKDTVACALGRTGVNQLYLLLKDLEMNIYLISTRENIRLKFIRI